MWLDARQVLNTNTDYIVLTQSIVDTPRLWFMLDVHSEWNAVNQIIYIGTRLSSIFNAAAADDVVVVYVWFRVLFKLIKLLWDMVSAPGSNTVR